MPGRCDKPPSTHKKEGPLPSGCSARSGLPGPLAPPWPLGRKRVGKIGEIVPRGLRKHWQVNVRNGPDDPTLSHTSSGLRDLSAITRGISRLELEQDSSGRLAASCHARSRVRRVQSLKDHAEGTETCKIIERNVLCHCMTTCVKEIPTPTTFSRQRHLKPAPSPNPPPPPQPSSPPRRRERMQ